MSNTHHWGADSNVSEVEGEGEGGDGHIHVVGLDHLHLIVLWTHVKQPQDAILGTTTTPITVNPSGATGDNNRRRTVQTAAGDSCRLQGRLPLATFVD